MIKLLSTFVIFGFKLFAKRRYDAFIRDLKDPEGTQLKLKAQLKKKYLKSERYNHTQIDFEALETHNYNELIAVTSIEDVCSDKIVCYEETSGSSGIKKKIPYTRELLNSFSSMFILWAYDILKGVRFESYQFYFSISPQFTDSSNGLEDDSEYLGPFLSFFISPFIVQLKGAKSIRNSDEFLMKLALTLVSNRKLEVISIWSPTFLLSLLDFIKENEADFMKVLALGEYEDLKFKAYRLESVSTNDLFPNLKFVSSWGSATAKSNFDKLSARLPKGVTMQKKGLLATEAPMTIPLLGHPGGVPLISEVFFEFLDPNGAVKYLWEIKEGIDYELILSQKGGLYRYPMKDLVHVVGYIEKTPLLDFKGRSSQTSDLVGEKIHESEAFKALEGHAVALIASVEELRYFILADQNFKNEELEAIDKHLRENPHYHNARELKQLKELKVIKCDNPLDRVRDYHQKILGINLGDIKDSVLIYREGDAFIKQLL